MSGPTDYMEKLILDTFLGTVTGNSLGTQGQMWLGLFLVMPADDGTGGTEVTGGSYGRVQINGSVNQWAAATSATAPTVKLGPTGANTWVFPAPTANWGDTVGIGIWDASTSGNMLWTGQYVGGIVVTVNSGDPALTFDSGHQLTVQAGDPGDPFT
jgi:hypothetical protein